MTDEKGPLEQEIFDTFQKASLADPVVFGLVHGTLTPAEVKELGVNERAGIDALHARILGATRASIERLANEIDALKAATDNGNDPSDPG